MQYHAPHDPPPDRRIAIRGEVDTERRAQERKDPTEARFVVDRRHAATRFRHRHVGVPRNTGKLARDLLRRHDHVDAAAAYRRNRHPRVFRRLLPLGEGDPARGLDVLEAERAVGAGPRENHSDGGALPIFGKRSQERIDGKVRAGRVAPRPQLQDALLDRHRRIAGDDVDAVRLDGHAVRGFVHRHRRSPGEDAFELALARGIEVLDEYECHAGVARNGLEQLADCLESAGRGADGDDRERGAVRRRGGWQRGRMRSAGAIVRGGLVRAGH